MNKNLFKRVISLVIVLMMIMPNMPGGMVRADEDVFGSGEGPDFEVTGQTNDITTDSAIHGDPISDLQAGQPDEVPQISTNTYEFYIEGDETPYDIKVINNGESLIEPKIPEVEGKIFIGWYVDGIGQLVFGEPIEVLETKTIIVNAKFEELLLNTPTALTFVDENVKIEVSAEYGVLPEGTSLLVEPLSDMEVDMYLDAIEENKGFLISYAAFYDINLLDRDGNTIQPNGDVNVTFEGLEFVEGEDIFVYHVENKIEKNIKRSSKIAMSTSSNDSNVIINDIHSTSEKGKISFITDHFSVYVVGTGFYSSDNNRYIMDVGETVNLRNDDSNDSSGTWSITSGNDIVEISSSNGDTSTIEAIEYGLATIRYRYSNNNRSFYIKVIKSSNDSLDVAEIQVPGENQLEPGDVAAKKTAQWVDYENREAVIDLSVAGMPIITGSDIILVMDVSGSMSTNNRIGKAQQASIEFVNKLLGNGNPLNNRIAFIPFSGVSGGGTNATAVNNATVGRKNFSYDVDLLKEHINSTSANGYTNYSAALIQSINYDDTRTVDEKADRPLYIVFMSDGEPNPSSHDGATQAATLTGPARKATIYTVGIQLTSGSNGETRLKNISSLDENNIPLYKSVTDMDDLQPVLDKIAGSIKKAGTLAYFKDYISEYFDFISTDPSSGVYDPADRSVTFNVGDILEDSKTFKIYVQLKEEYRNSEADYPTNSDVRLDYKDIDGEDAHKTKEEIGDPELPVGYGKIDIEYYLVNSAGQYVDKTNPNIILTPDFKSQAKITSEAFEYDGSSQLDVGGPDDIGVTYSVPANVPSGYILYSGETSPKNQTVSFNSRNATVEFKVTVNMEVTVTANNVTVDYNGQPHGGNGAQASGLLPGHSLQSVIVTGSETNAGTYEDKLVPSAAVIVDASNNDVTSSYSNISYVVGDLTINKKEVSLVSKNLSKVYDGTALTNGSEPLATETGWVSGEGATYTFTGSQTDVGNSANAFSYTLNAGTLVDNYTINKTEGTLTVTKNLNAITITADSDSKVYDGAALTDSGYTYTPGILAAGDVLTAVVEGTITNAGTADNVVTSYKVMRGEGEGAVDVTSFYTFGDSVKGSLTINKRTVVMTSASDEKTYDGTPLTNDEVTVTGDGFVTGEGASYNVTGSQTDVGDSKNTFTYTLNQGTLAGNYDIEKVEGTLEVTEAPPIDIIVEKYWNDNGDDQGPVVYNGLVEAVKPPITFRLWIGDEEVDSLILQNGETTGVFKDKPVYDAEGKKIIYSITEDTITGYDSSIDGPYEDGDVYVYVTNTIKSFTVSYNANGGSGTMVDENNPYKFNSPVTVLANAFARTNYRFTGWNTQANGSGTDYEAGSIFGMPAHDVTLYAQWSRRSTPPGPPVVIDDPTPPLAELEKFDHFAYVIGYPEGDVRPLNNITREEVAMIFYRLLTDESRNQLLSDVNPFTDMDQYHAWSNRAVSTLYNAGIIAGYPDGTFRPSEPITRAEFATIAAKFDKLEVGSTSKFTDIFGHWAEKYITSSEIKGWIKGYPDMTFKPEQDITRAEAMTLINNVLERKVPEENIHPDAMFWPDNPITEWYYEAVMEATNSHDYVIEEDGDELWTGMKPNKVWP